MTNTELLQYGFKFERVFYCCGGAKNERYTNGEYELRIRPKQKQYKLSFRGSGIGGWRALETLKYKLDELQSIQA